MLNKDQIQEIIPHRHEMLLIDQIDALVPGETASGKMICSDDKWYFKGHFPEYPVTPGVLIVEALAQTAAVCHLSLEEHKGKIGFFAGINSCKFKQQVRPGDVLDLEIETTKTRRNISVVTAKAMLNGKVAAQAELTLAIGE